MKISELKTAREVRRGDAWGVRWRYWVGWPKNQLEILALRVRARQR
jgi:hypothetical protein